MYSKTSISTKCQIIIFLLHASIITLQKVF